MGLEAAAGPAARTGGGDRRALGHCRVECARRWGSSAATSQAFRTTAPGMPRGALPAG